MTDEHEADWVYGEDDLAVMGRNIAGRRKSVGMSQTALADAMVEQGFGHWRQNTVSRVERGQQELTVREADALGRILGGGVLLGTQAERSSVGLAHFGLRIMLQTHLAAAERALEETAAELQWLRQAVDRLYSEAEEGGDDGERPEAP